MIATNLKRGFILIDAITGRRRNFIKPTDRRETGAIERKILNSPVQGVSGSMTKLALVKLDAYLTKHRLHGKVLITNAVHDEIVIDCLTDNEDQVKLAASLLEKSMVEAGYVFCKTVPLKAEAVITPFWTH